ncbi:hypothetical protein LWM68_12615 [Niabella sp. W65]|nr:hypothetical protein [Niabella sp. W65]MCH7363514.1 hypothetical protein [Niabella sp. W65]ULT39433.1 hypothetical protein KRR40_31410 [Niabella sp. I65]
MQPGSKPVSIFNLTVIVAALGYFVDIYDLLLFGIIRIPSLREMGLTPDQITTDGESILSWQMFGLMLGGILWGIVGDKKEDRVYCSVLYCCIHSEILPMVLYKQ